MPYMLGEGKKLLVMGNTIQEASYANAQNIYVYPLTKQLATVTYEQCPIMEDRHLYYLLIIPLQALSY